MTHPGDMVFTFTGLGSYLHNFVAKCKPAAADEGWSFDDEQREGMFPAEIPQQRRMPLHAL